MTLVAMKASWRRPATASATISSARPSAYISAVSMWVRPRSSPRDSAAISSFLSLRSSPMCQVPWPTTATSTPVIPNGRLITRRVYTGRRWGGLAWPCRVAGAHAPAEPEDGRGETDQHRCGCERGQLGHPLDRGAAQAHEGEPDDREHGRAAAHHRAAAGGQPEDAAEGAQHASRSAGSATPRDDGEPSAALHPQREVQCHEERHEGEAREVRRRHREAPLESERVVRGEPEEGQTPGLGEALPERPRPGHEVAGQSGQKGADGEGGDRLAGDGECERRHQEVEGEDAERDGTERQRPRPHSGPETSKRPPDRPHAPS